MAWKRTPHERFRVVERIRASGGEDEISRERATLRDAMLRAAVAEGLIPEADLPSWQRHAEADPHGVAELIREMSAARRQSGNGDVAATAPRREPDGEQLVASAIKARKFRESRREFLLSRYRANPQATRATIEALQPLPPFIAAMVAMTKKFEGR